MVSTPPKVAGSPDQIAYNRWVREQLEDIQVASSGRDKRVSAVESSATNATNLASSTSSSQATLSDQVIGMESDNRLARPILDGDYWSDVIAGRRFVWEYPSSVAGNGPVRSVARNVTWLSSGAFLLQPNADIEGAEIDITPILPTPQSNKLYVEAEYGGSTSILPQIWITWRDSIGNPFPPDGTEATPTLAPSKSIVNVPKLASGQYPSKYSVALVRPAGAGLGATISPKVFEVIGTSGLAISPGGISVEDSSGNKTVEINPALPVLAAPTAPILTSGSASVSVRWNGLLTSGAAPANLSYVYAEEAPAVGGPWTRVGQPLNRTGDTITRPPVGSTRWYRFTAVDTSNRPSLPGASASIVVVGVGLPDITSDIIDAIDQAQADADAAQAAADAANAQALAAAGIANSKGKVLTQNAAPGVADQNANTLWIDTTGGANTPKRWNGTTWVAVTDKTATDAAAAAAAAQTAANNAAAAALAAQTTADGKNRIYLSVGEPAVAPSELKPGDLWYVRSGDTSIITAVNIWNGTIWNPYRLVADQILVPGSLGTISIGDGVITAPKIKLRELEGEHFKVGSISVDELTPNIGSSINININPAITDLQNGLEEQQRYYRFDSQGLKIGDPATNEELRLNPGRIEMVQAGNVPTWWEAQTFYVDRMVVNAANIGEHRWEKYSTGRSVIRPLI
jgi:hypothetical protein